MLEILILLFRLKLKLTEIQMPAWSAMYASVLSLKGKCEEVVARAEANSPDPTQYTKNPNGKQSFTWTNFQVVVNREPWACRTWGEHVAPPTRRSLYKTHFTCFAQRHLLPPNIKKENETFTFPTVIPQPPTRGPSLQPLSALVWKRHSSQAFLGDSAPLGTFCGVV